MSVLKEILFELREIRKELQELNKSKEFIVDGSEICKSLAIRDVKTKAVRLGGQVIRQDITSQVL